jgi:hypothetical protein
MSRSSRVITRLVLVGLIAVILNSQGDGSASTRMPGAAPFPRIPRVKEPAAEPAAIEETYRFVAEHPEIARYVPCFCACSRTKHHRSIEDCFVKSRHSDGRVAAWTGHAAECYICITVAQEAKASYLNGMSTSSIRTHIEKDLAPKFKYHTDTPLPPAN